jgi:hypothetical protein
MKRRSRLRRLEMITRRDWIRSGEVKGMVDYSKRLLTAFQRSYYFQHLLISK